MLKLSDAFWSQSKHSDFQSLDLATAGSACGMVRQSSSGLWELDCFGAALAARLESRLRSMMAGLGFHEVRFCMMQDQALWDATGRDKDYGQELYELRDRRGKRMRLAATAEEAATRAASEHAKHGARSLRCWQIGAKWRDETRARGALARAREFSMLDAYCFHETLELARADHGAFLAAALAELAALGLKARARGADCGEVGGLESVEIEVDSSELGDADGHLELAHLFLLGTRYSEAFGLLGRTGSAMQMGCQGIGSSRLLMALLEARRTATGFYGDEAACSHLFWITALDTERDARSMEAALALAKASGRDGILDDRAMSAGRKLRDAESCMAAWRIVASSRSLSRGAVEFKALDGSRQFELSVDQACAFIAERRAAFSM